MSEKQPIETTKTLWKKKCWFCGAPGTHLAGNIKRAVCDKHRFTLEELLSFEAYLTNE